MLTLSGETSILGRAVIVHADKDDLSSQPAGNSGARIACGVIEEQKAGGSRRRPAEAEPTVAPGALPGARREGGRATPCRAAAFAAFGARGRGTGQRRAPACRMPHPRQGRHAWQPHATIAGSSRAPAASTRCASRRPPDLAHLDELDQKLWAALACPVKGLEFDERTLALIDTDKRRPRARARGHRRGRSGAARGSRTWPRSRLGTDALPLGSIDDSERGRQGRAGQRAPDPGGTSASRSAAAITLADVDDTARSFAQTQLQRRRHRARRDSADDADARSVIEDVIATPGSVTDRSGQPGIDQAQLDALLRRARRVRRRGRREGATDAALRPLGEATAAAAAAWRRGARQGRRLLRALPAGGLRRARAGRAEPREERVPRARRAGPDHRGQPRSPASRWRAIEAGRALPLDDGVNPAWAAAIASAAQPPSSSRCSGAARPR